MTNERIYLDHSATTPIDPRVLAAMEPYWTGIFGHPASQHWAGQATNTALDEARETIATVIKCSSAEIVFTSGGTESNNLVIRDVAAAMRAQGKGAHIITTQAEHHTLLDAAHELANDGFDVTFLPVNEYGRVTVEQVLEALRDDTILVSIIYANNEVGTVNPITGIGLALRGRDIPFHTDAVQAPGLLPLDINALNVNLMSLSAHKCYGPKGIGMLYAHHTVPLKPQEAGSVQPANQHSGFEPVPLIAGLAEALWVAEVERVETVARTLQLRNTLIHRILETVPEAALTGHPTQRLPNHASFALKGLNGDAILHDLNKVGIAAGGGSASASGKQEPSHVLTAMRIPPNRIKGQVRFVLGRDSTHQQVEHLLSHLEAIIARQRAARDNA